MPRPLVPQLNRIQTIVAATSYTFPIEDAFGYPAPLPQARKIGLGRRSLTGLLSSAKKTEGLGPFESSLERDFFVLLEFDRKVLAWHPQPVTLSFPAANGYRGGKYTPDVAVEYSDKPDGTELSKVELCEIKYRDELKADWKILKTRFKQGVKYARSQGWRFRIVTETSIRTPLLQNAKFFLPYRSRGTDEEDIHFLMKALLKEGVSTPNILLSTLHIKETDRPRMIGVLWHMIATGRIEVNFEHKVNMNSPIRMFRHGRD